MAAVTLPLESTLYVGNLDPSVTEAHLFGLLTGFGPISSIRVVRERGSGKSLRYAYVNFPHRHQAATVLSMMNHKPFLGKPMRIMWRIYDPKTRMSGVGNVFVKNLDPSIGEAELVALFAKYGSVVSCKVAVDHEGRSKGFGFVQMDGEDSAKNAINVLHGKWFANKLLYVAKFVSKTQRQVLLQAPKCTNLYIKNLGRNFTDENLFAKFSEFGTVKSATIVKDGTGKSKGYGFVNFDSPEQAQKAMDAMNGSTLGSNTIFVGPAQRKAERENLLREYYGDKYQDQRSKMIQESNVFVKFLHSSVDDKALRQLFLQCGKVVTAKVMLHYGISRCFGYVCFSSPQEAKKAVAMLHGTEFRGKRLHVAIAQRKEERIKQTRCQLANTPHYNTPYYLQHHGQFLHYFNFPYQYQSYEYVPQKQTYHHQWENNNTPYISYPYQYAPYVPVYHTKFTYPTQATRPYLQQKTLAKSMPNPAVFASSLKITDGTERLDSKQLALLPSFAAAGLEEKDQELEMKTAAKITSKLCEILLSPQQLAERVKRAAAVRMKNEQADFQSGVSSSIPEEDEHTLIIDQEKVEACATEVQGEKASSFEESTKAHFTIAGN